MAAAQNLFSNITYSIFYVVTGSYAISVLFFLGLRLVIGESWWVVALFNALVHLLLLPALALLPMSLLLRRWGLVVLLIPAVASFIWWYAPSFLPKEIPEVPEDAQTLTVLSFNLKALAFRPILQEYERIILEADADVVALQEFSMDADAYLRVALADDYPYQALHHVPYVGVKGQAIFSRYPIVEDEFWLTGLGQQRVEIDVKGQPVIIYNIHAMSPVGGSFEQRSQDVRDIHARAQEETGALLILGDFNMTERSDVYAMMAQSYRDAYAEVGYGFGFTFKFTIIETLPFLRLDYVFYNESIEVVEARVMPDAGDSDHYPLLVTLILNPS